MTVGKTIGDVLNAHEAAQMLGAHVETIRRMARRGALPAYKIGKDWRFRKDALLHWLQPGRPEPKNATILIVDDDPSNRSRVSRYLEGAGFGVISVSNGIDALSLTQKDASDLLLLDLNCAPIKSSKFIEVLRQTHPQLPIVVTSDCKDNHLIMTTFRQGPFMLVPKPIDKKALISAVRMTLAGSLAEQAVA